MEYLIRAATLEDKKFITRLYAQARAEVGQFNPYSVWEKHIEGKGSERFIIVPEMAVCFYFFSKKHKCYVLSDIVVHKEHRKKGLGAFIVTYLIKRCRRLKSPLMCKSKVTNENAVFWAKMGFKNIGQTTNEAGELHDVWIIT